MSAARTNPGRMHSASAAWLLTRLMCVAAIAVMAAATGCAQQPSPGMAAAKVRVEAKPKPGAPRPASHVGIYDVAPAAEKPGGQFEQVDYERLDNIIVWLEPAAGNNRGQTPIISAPVTSAAASTLPPPQPRTIEVDAGKAASDWIAASVGQRLVFRNRSSRPVALYSVSDGNDFELASIAPGASGEYTVRTEGPIEVLSDPARPPVTLIYAAPTPLVARAAAGRTVTFNDVPPGSYQAMSWHPRLPGASAPITLTAGNVSGCTLSVGVGNLASK